MFSSIEERLPYIRLALPIVSEKMGAALFLDSAIKAFGNDMELGLLRPPEVIPQPLGEI